MATVDSTALLHKLQNINPSLISELAALYPSLSNTRSSFALPSNINVANDGSSGSTWSDAVTITTHPAGRHSPTRFGHAAGGFKTAELNNKAWGHEVAGPATMPYTDPERKKQLKNMLLDVAIKQAEIRKNTRFSTKEQTPAMVKALQDGLNDEVLNKIVDKVTQAKKEMGGPAQVYGTQTPQKLIAMNGLSAMPADVPPPPYAPQNGTHTTHTSGGSMLVPTYQQQVPLERPVAPAMMNPSLFPSIPSAPRWGALTSPGYQEVQYSSGVSNVPIEGVYGIKQEPHEKTLYPPDRHEPYDPQTSLSSRPPQPPSNTEGIAIPLDPKFFNQVVERLNDIALQETTVSAGGCSPPRHVPSSPRAMRGGTSHSSLQSIGHSPRRRSKSPPRMHPDRAALIQREVTGILPHSRSPEKNDPLLSQSGGSHKRAGEHDRNISYSRNDNGNSSSGSRWNKRPRVDSDAASTSNERQWKRRRTEIGLEENHGAKARSRSPDGSNGVGADGDPGSRARKHVLPSRSRHHESSPALGNRPQRSSSRTSLPAAYPRTVETPVQKVAPPVRQRSRASLDESPHPHPRSKPPAGSVPSTPDMSTDSQQINRGSSIPLNRTALNASSALLLNSPQVQYQCPGLWLAKVGASYAKVIRIMLDIDEETSKKWHIYPPSNGVYGATKWDRAPPKLRLNLVCLSTQAVEAKQREMDKYSNPLEMLGSIPTQWPENGRLIMQMNKDRLWGRTWLPRHFSAQAHSPMDVTRHICQGMNEILLIQLADLSDCTFILIASPVDPMQIPSKLSSSYSYRALDTFLAKEAERLRAHATLASSAPDSVESVTGIKARYGETKLSSVVDTKSLEHGEIQPTSEDAATVVEDGEIPSVNDLDDTTSSQRSKGLFAQAIISPAGIVATC